MQDFLAQQLQQRVGLNVTRQNNTAGMRRGSRRFAQAGRAKTCTGVFNRAEKLNWPA